MNIKLKLKFILPVFIFLNTIITAQTPVIKVDLNINSRSESEVNEPGYFPWPVNNAPDSITIEGITFTFKTGSFGDGWYKAGVQAPYYARLVNDGMRTSAIELHISGLQNGIHSLLTFHNTFDNPETTTFSPVDIYVNESLTINDLQPTNRVLDNEEATTAYLQFEVDNNEDVVIRFEGDPPLPEISSIITICGFELNTGNLKKQAKFPFPVNGDEHVDIDNDTLILIWTPAENVVSHDVYMGTDASEVLQSDSLSPLYLGNQIDTFLLRTGFYNLNSYYWRIDQITSGGEKTKGNVWYFKPRIPAFPGADGYGKYAIGGRGGKVVYVTNLDDSGPGSFREAVENDIGPRTILFAVSGMIDLESRLGIKHDYITVAGQTAPGKGICIRRAPIGVTGDDLIVQNLRVRLGAGKTFDGMGLTGANHSIIDHCSISWTIDEAFSSRGAKNITLQRTLISEALNAANHENYPPGTQHGYAASIGGDIGSFHHNLLAHCYGRNWSLAGGLDGNGYYAGRLDIFNNVVYNWDRRTTDGGAHEVNFVNNYYKPGESSTKFVALNAQYDNFPGTQRYYFTGNVMPGVFDETNQEDGKEYSGEPQGYSPWVDTAFFESDATIHSATDAYKNVLSDVGCTQPVFDNHDIRIINETLEGSYVYRGSITGKAGLPDSEEDVGGWENYPDFRRSENWDTDLDGLPDWWENVIGTNTNSALGDFSESNADTDKNGYTNLEEYLQWMSIPHYFIDIDEVLSIDLSMYTRGFTQNPEYNILKVTNGTAEILTGSSIINFTPILEGMAEIEFTVSDSEESTMYQQIGIFIGSVPEDIPVNTEPMASGQSQEFYTLIETDIRIYPNPAKDLVNIFLDSNESSTISIAAINVMGKYIRLPDIEFVINIGYNEIPLVISSLPPGVYILQIIMEDIRLAKKLIIK